MSDHLQVITIPSPTGGWNRRDAIASMEQSDAIVMDNFVSTSGYVKVRGGTQMAVNTLLNEDMTDINFNPISTLIQYIAGKTKSLIFTQRGNDGFVRFFKTEPSVDAVPAMWNGKIQDISPEEIDLYSDQWKELLFQGRLFVCSKTGDEPLVYLGGDAMIEHSFTVADDTKKKYKKIVGDDDDLDFGDLWDICAYNKRIFMIEKNSLNLWYTVSAGTIGGPIDVLDLSDFAKKGGEVVGIAEWTRTGANDMSSMLVVLTSEGEVLMFQGMDPTDMEEWELKGMYNIPSPIGYRCITKQMGELVFATKGGYYNTSSITGGASVEKESALTDKIRGAMASLKEFYDDEGWQVIFLQAINYMIINIPVNDTSSQQYVLNLENNTWSRFTGINAMTFLSYGDEVYFGGKKGNIYRLFSGGNDNGVQINASCLSAFSVFGDQNLKHVKNISLMVGAAYEIEFKVLISCDFNLQSQSCSVYTVGAKQDLPFSSWDKAEWDTSQWGAPSTAEELDVQELKTVIYSVPARYFSTGIQLRPYAADSNDIVWHSTVFMYEQEN